MEVRSDSELEAQVEEWSSNSNECFTVELVRGDGAVPASFHPDFTYHIFEDEEAIFGYKNLDIRLSFAAHNLRPHLAISYSKKFPSQGDVHPTDIHEALRDSLPASAFTDASSDVSLRDETAADFTPPGEKVRQYSREGERYEIWCAGLSDPAAKQLLDNMQVLVPMFIEGGTKLELEHDWSTRRWKIFLLYHVDSRAPSAPTSSPYTLNGYGTSYRIFTFPDRHKHAEADLDPLLSGSQPLESFLPPPQTTLANDLAPSSIPNDMTSPLDLPSRERLSQFLIFPPFQGAGHGRELYDSMYRHLSAPDNVREFTVEDPNEAFDDLRDLCDLLHLRRHVPDFASLRINSSLPAAELAARSPIPIDNIVRGDVRERVRKETKIMPRQFDRLVEMHTLSFIPPLHRSRSRITRKENSSNEHDRAYYLWRLYAKERLYIFNRDQLAQLEREERVEKLEAALDSVQEAYMKLLEKAEVHESDDRASANNGGAISDEGIPSGKPRSRGSKRKIALESEEDDEDDDAGAEGEEGDDDDTAGALPILNGRKRARVA